jgi:hypothetical protein
MIDGNDNARVKTKDTRTKSNRRRIQYHSLIMIAVIRPVKIEFQQQCVLSRFLALSVHQHN